METSYLKTLELDKIIARAAEGCVCKEAREMLLATQPQCDPDEVRYALEQTDAINTLLIKNGSPRFGGVENVSQLAARAVKGGVLSMGELLMVAGALRNFQNLSSWYGASEHDALPTDDLFYALAPQPGLEQQISSAILAPDAMADTASHTLNDLRNKIRATENSIRDRLESMVRNMDTSKYLQESVVSMRNGRYVVPVKSEYRGEVSGIIHDVSSTGATVFVEPQAVVEANARILQYRAQEAQEIERILVAFTAQVAAIEPQFQYSYKAMLEIDVLLAKARLALDLKAFKPAVRTDDSFSLIRARHPLIDPKKCVPVDIALGRDYDSLIITGPNTGGKTVTLKTAGLLCAMAVFSYLYASRSVGMLHALPLRREGLFLTNYLSGLLFLLLPNLAVFLLALAAEVFAGTVVFSSLFTWLVVVSLFGLFFYSFAVFCAMFTGHVLALPAFYVVLNGLAAGLCWVFSRMAEEFLFGFTSAAWLEKLGVWLTPVLLLSEACHVQYDTITDAAGNSMLGDPYFAGLGYASLYALIGLVLAGLALAAYRRRHLESAGDVVSVRWVRPVFKYGVAFCTAVTLSTVFYYVLDPLLPRGPWTLLVLMVVWGAAGCFVAEMLLCKSFWVFRGAWKGCVVFLPAAMCAMEFDITGFEGRVPDAAEVQSAHLSGMESAPYDDLGYATLTLDTPEELEALTGLHQSIVAHKEELEEADWESTWSEDGSGLSIQSDGWTYVDISYTLMDGSYLTRKYRVPLSQSELDTPGTPAARLDALLNAPGLAGESYFHAQREGDRLVDAWLTNPDTDSAIVPASALTGLEEAVRADLAEGTLGRRYLLENRDRLENCYYNDLYLEFRPAGRTGGEEEDGYTVCITLQSGARHTLAVLQACGLDGTLVTQAQIQKEDAVYAQSTTGRG